MVVIHCTLTYSPDTFHVMSPYLVAAWYGTVFDNETSTTHLYHLSGMDCGVLA